MTLSQDVLGGSRLALARLLTHIENNTAEGKQALGELYPLTGRAHLIGVTGAPGTGKSSLVNHLAYHFRHNLEDESRRVGVVAVDPSSPFTGGAILGDRVRMRDLAGDPGVFIRSMASRGSLGGLASATSGVVQALDAAGFDIVIIETVGAGQAEVDIARLAHTTLVIEAPGLGDDIQAIKAGILEIADVLVVNKADRPGVESTERALKSMLQLGHPVPRVFDNHIYRPDGTYSAPEEPDLVANGDIWIPPIQRTIATDGTGISELVEAIQNHYAYLQKTGELQRRELARLRSELDLLLREALMVRWRERVPRQDYENALQRLLHRQLSPWQVVETLIDGDKR